MNKIYKLVWNAGISAWTVVSELTSSKTKAKKSTVATAIAVMGLLGAAQQAAAYEAGGGNTNLSCTNYSATGSKSDQSVAIGSSNSATGPESGQACAPTKYSIAVGAYSSTAGADGNNQAIAIGYKTTASGDQAIALGANVNASGNSSVAIGGDDIDKAIDSDGAAYTELTGDVLKKKNFVPTTASGAASLALGVQNVASGAFSAAVGSNSKATGLAAVALGTNAKATDKGALAIGAVSNAAASGAIAVGLNTTAAGVNSTAIGSGNTAGAGATTSGDNATAIGSGASASADATAIGTGAKATLAGGVAIGTEAVSAIDKDVAGYDPITGQASTAANSTWQSTRAAVSVGDVANGITRQITGVAAGTADTDVVNVAQLKTIKTYADTIANSTADALGGGAQLDMNTGSITAPTYTLGGTDYNNVGDALQAAKTVVVKGNNMKVSEAKGANGESIYTVATDTNVKFDTVTVGNVKLDQATDTMTGLSNKDLSAADFATAGRAATEEQVKVVQGNVQNIIGGNTVINPDGSITNMDIGGTGANNVNDAIKNVNTASKAAKTVVVEGNNMKVSEAKGENGESIYTVATDTNVKFDTVTVGNVKLDQATNTMTGLSNKDLSAADFATAGRAATEEQVQVVQGNVQNIIGGNTVINPDGSITNMDIGGTGANNVNDAIKNVNTASKAAKTVVVEGNNMKVSEAKGENGESIYTVATDTNVKFDTVTVGNVKLDQATDTMTGLSNKDLTAANFATAGRAATEEQVQVVQGNVQNIIGGNTVINPDGSITNTDIGGTGANNVNDAIKNVNTASKAAKTVVIEGNNMKVSEAKGENGESIYTVATDTNVKFDTVTVGNVKLDQATNTMTGLSNKDLTAADFATVGRAATEEQVQVVQGNVQNIIGGNTVINPDGSITNADIGGTGANNVNDAIKNVNTASKAAKTKVIEGDNIDVLESFGVDGESIYTVSTARNVNFDSVTVGNVLMSGSSNTIIGLSNTDLSASDFATAGRAATEEQLQAVKDELKGAQQTANEGAVKYDKNADGSVNKDSVTFEGKPSNATQDANSGKITSTGGTSLDNVASAGDYTDVNNANKAVNAGDLNNAILDASKNTADIIGGNTTVNADGSISNNDIGGTGQSTVHDAISSINQATQAAKAEVKQGDNIVVTESTGSNGQSIYTVSTAKDVKFDSVTADSVTVGNVSITDKGINAGNTQITGVANGAVNSSSQDAINGSQLNASNEQVANALGGGAKFENNQMTAPSYTTGHGDNAQTHNNVGSALDALNKQDQVLGNSIQNLNQGLQDANRRIDDVEKKANAGIAAAMAMETAPFIAGKYTYAVGAAYHGGENAVGATLRKTSDNGRWSFTGGVAAGSQGAASVRVGFSGIIN